MHSSFMLVQTSVRILISIPYEMGKSLDSFEHKSGNVDS